MQKVHRLLLEKIQWYRNWHTKPKHNEYHWGLLLLAVFVFATIHIPFTQQLIHSDAVDQLVEEVQEVNSEAAVIRAVKPGKAKDRIIVKFKEDTLTTRKNALYNAKGLRERSEIARVRAKIVTIPENTEPAEMIEELKAEYGELIEYAEVDELVSPSFTPNDPSFSSQWPHTKINSVNAWDGVSVENMDDIIIGIADTGVNCNHADLAASCIAGWNTYDNNANTADVYGHGTKVAGTAAAVGNNTLGVTGVAYKAKIMPLRISMPDGSAFSSSAATAIIWAADRGAKVVNTSYAFSPTNRAIADAAAYLKSKGGILVESAGNSGGATGALVDNPDRVTVGGTTSGDAKYSWSAYGPNVDLTAPGCAGKTTLRSGGYGDGCGTSYSAPITAGALAVVMAARPGMTGAEARDILFATSKDLGAAGRDDRFGHGRIDLAAAVSRALGSALPPPPPPAPTGDTSAPSVPTNIAATATTNQISITWSASTDNVAVTGYKLYRNGSLYKTITTNSYTDTTVSAATTYSYRVSAQDAAGNSSVQSNQVSVTVAGSPSDTTAPSVPGNVSATVTTNQISITWSASTDNVAVTGYKLYRNGSLYKTLTGTSYTDTTVSSGNTYTYTVSAHDAAGNNSGQSAAVSKAIATTTTTESLAITAHSVTPQSTTATVTLSANRPVAIYLYYGTGYYTLDKSVVNKTKLNDHTITIPNLQPNTQYYYRTVVQSQSGATNGTAKTSFTTLSK